ncbi:MAG: GNAT family N-acetyltransferase [Candidatus Izimaplasma sp.]|nr:GNAT family N-acetyltransferase [Candidatus Izimaplasma bacterium]
MSKIKYINDKDFKYSEDIKKGLQSYNQSQAGYREKDYQHFYVFEDKKLVGASHTKMASDWCHIRKIYYQDLDVLKALLNDIKNYYKHKVEGIRVHTVLPNRVDDYKAMGFIEKGRLEDMPSGGENVFLLTTDLEHHEIDKEYASQSSNVPIKTYDKVLKKENKKIRENLNFSTEVVDIQYVVLEDGKFIGGIYGNFKYDYLFINILFVDKKYRGLGIASKLMELIEAESAKREVYNIYLTTFEFQALGFYKKRGYEEVMDIYDYPIGFKEYTVYKNIEPEKE